jgi:hypothetical protein
MCSCAPGCGSFIKFDLLNSGVDLLAALEEKYLDTSTASTSGDATINACGGIVGISGKSIPVLLVGDNKVRYMQFHNES